MQDTTRRRFLALLGGGATALWIGDHLDLVREAAAQTADLAAAQRALEFFTRAQYRTAQAVAARIIPNDDGTPGAAEAGAADFMDRVLARYLPDATKAEVRDGLAALDRDAASEHGVRDFAGATKEQQDAMLRAREKEAYFETLRSLSIAGVLSSPKHGGNRNYIGWRMVRHDPSPVYQPPFGYYDRPANLRRALNGGADD